MQADTPGNRTDQWFATPCGSCRAENARANEFEIVADVAGVNVRRFTDEFGGKRLPVTVHEAEGKRRRVDRITTLSRGSFFGKNPIRRIAQDAVLDPTESKTGCNHEQTECQEPPVLAPAVHTRNYSAQKTCGRLADLLAKHLRTGEALGQRSLFDTAAILHLRTEKRRTRKGTHLMAAPSFGAGLMSRVFGVGPSDQFKYFPRAPPQRRRYDALVAD